MNLQKTNKIKYLSFIFFCFLLIIIFWKRDYVTVKLLERTGFLGQSGDLLTEREQFESLKVENKLLKSELTNLENSVNMAGDGIKPNFLRVIAGPSILYKNFYVTRPNEKTIYKDMFVYTGEGTVSGRISEILDNSLKVEYLGYGKSFTGVGSDSEESIEFNALSLGLYVGKISGGSKLEVGEVVTLKENPRGVVGTVVEIQKGDNTLSNVYVRAPVNIFNKNIFYVLE